MRKFHSAFVTALATLTGTAFIPVVFGAVSNDQILSLVKQQQSIIAQQQHQLDHLSAQREARREKAMPAINLNDGESTPAPAQQQAYYQPQADNTVNDTSEVNVRIVNAYPSKASLISQASSGGQATELPYPKLVLGTQDSNISIYGQVGMLAMLGMDGKKEDLFWASNANNNTRLMIDSKSKVNDDVTVGTKLQLGFQINQSNVVSQTNQSPSSSIDTRKAEAFFKSKRLGTLYMGKGSTASDNTANTDLSGTRVVSRSSVADIGGGLYFKQSDGTISTATVSNAFNNLDGLGRKVRLRYDTPSMKGFVISGSLGEHRADDIAVKYGQDFGSMKMVAQAAYTSRQTFGVSGDTIKGNIADGSASMLLNGGFNFTLAGGKVLATDSGSNRRDPLYFYVKPGYRLHIFNTGLTAMAINYGRYNYFANNNEHGTTYGATVLQNLNAYHMAVYADYRHFKVTGTSSTFKPINVISAGIFYKF